MGNDNGLPAPSHGETFSCICRNSISPNYEIGNVVELSIWKRFFRGAIIRVLAWRASRFFASMIWLHFSRFQHGFDGKRGGLVEPKFFQNLQEKAGQLFRRRVQETYLAQKS